jgi:hypothetical protein
MAAATDLNSMCLVKCVFIYMVQVTKEKILEVCNASSSLTEAASKLGVNYKTLRRLAKLYGCFNPNPSGKGTLKPKQQNGKSVFRTKDILEGKHPQYQSFKLKQRLFREHIKDEKCERCGIEKWLGAKLPLELEHKDGNKYNNCLSNLEILCPNCHSLTATYRAKNKSLNREIG